MEKAKEILSNVKAKVDIYFSECMGLLNNIIPNFDNEENFIKTYDEIAKALAILNRLASLVLITYLSEKQKNMIKDKLVELTANDNFVKRAGLIRTFNEWLHEENGEIWQKIYVNYWKKFAPEVLNLTRYEPLIKDRKQYKILTLEEQDKLIMLEKISKKIYGKDYAKKIITSSTVSEEYSFGNSALLKFGVPKYMFHLSPNLVIKRLKNLSCDFSNKNEVKRFYGIIASLLYNMDMNFRIDGMKEIMLIKQIIADKMPTESEYNIQSFIKNDETLEIFYSYINYWMGQINDDQIKINSDKLRIHRTKYIKR